jgi:hypothetical protein
MAIGVSLAVLWGAMIVWLLLLITGRIAICNHERHIKHCEECGAAIKDQQTRKPGIGV